MHYTGYLLDGTKFDSSRDRGQTFSFVLGKGQVIKCWDMGVAQLVKGQKAIFNCPADVAYGNRGAGELLVTSMDRDGTQIGYDNDLILKISSSVNMPVIASGGVGNLDHLVDGIKLGNASAVLAASIFHYGTHTINEAKQYLNSKGIPVRI